MVKEERDTQRSNRTSIMERSDVAHPLPYSHVLWSIAVEPMFQLLPFAQVSS